MSSSDDDSDLTPESVKLDGKTVLENLLHLPQNSKERYLKTYDVFIKWRSEKKVKSLSESVLITYFNELAEKLKPSSLWSIYSMLKSTIITKHDIDLKNYDKLVSFLKRQSAGYKSKKSEVFTAEQVKTFLNEAPDEIYLAAKVEDGSTSNANTAGSSEKSVTASGSEQAHAGVQCKECGEHVVGMKEKYYRRGKKARLRLSTKRKRCILLRKSKTSATQLAKTNGFRFRCVECAEFDLCSDCEVIGTHADHYMLRVPANKPPEESTRLVKALRYELQLDAPKEEEPLVKVEIKEELPDPLENTQEPVESTRPHPDNEMEQSFITLEIQKIESDERSDITIEETMVQPAPVVTPAPQTITLDQSFGVPMLVLHPLSVKQPSEASKRCASPPPSPAPSKRPAAGADPGSAAAAPSRVTLTAADTDTGKFEIYSHNSASKTKGNAVKKKK